ncbi:MAG: hypothetical protein ABIW36_03470 [Terrimesophilobacter sp.]
MTRWRNRRGVAAALLGCALLLGGMTGCAVAPSAESSILGGELPANVTAKNVLVAAILLSTADIDGAVAEGLVTPAEVDAAAAAIKNDTLDLWRQRAEADR